jgi:hypothetical protein
LIFDHKCFSFSVGNCVTNEEEGLSIFFHQLVCILNNVSYNLSIVSVVTTELSVSRFKKFITVVFYLRLTNYLLHVSQSLARVYRSTLARSCCVVNERETPVSTSAKSFVEKFLLIRPGFHSKLNRNHHHATTKTIIE